MALVVRLMMPLERMMPSVMVRPPEEERPAVLMPPVNVDEAAAVLLIIPFVRRMPSVIVRPPVEARPALLTPPVNVEVPLPVTAIVEVEVNGPVFKEPVIMPLPSIVNLLPGVVVPLPIFE